MYVESPKCRTANENAFVWRDTLQVTKDEGIEGQEKMNCGIRLQVAAKADRSIMIRA